MRANSGLPTKPLGDEPMPRCLLRLALPFAFTALAALPVSAEGGIGGWFSGDWYLKVGGAGFTAPAYEGSSSYKFFFSPIVSLGKVGPEARFTSRNDAISLGLFDTGTFRAGLAGKLVMPRDQDDSPDLAGLKEVPFGVELGGFAEIYPTDWLRLRGEVRQGIRAHRGLVADLSADAFYDVTPVVRVSAGPRLSFASSKYFDAYYGIDAVHSAASGLAPYSPGGGVKSWGVGGAVDWQATERLTTSLFGEYARLGKPAADSSLVEAHGSADQFMVGVSASYRFNFTLGN